MWPAEDGQNVRASKTLGGIADLAGIRNLKSKVRAITRRLVNAHAPSPWKLYVSGRPLIDCSMRVFFVLVFSFLSVNARRAPR
jgi:hypothetical protein